MHSYERRPNMRFTQTERTPEMQASEMSEIVEIKYIY